MQAADLTRTPRIKAQIRTKFKSSLTSLVQTPQSDPDVHFFCAKKMQTGIRFLILSREKNANRGIVSELTKGNNRIKPNP